ncbi:hypothetical protein [Allorhizocola rhizosphaerae]|uniref:hypothetical protein n=1 Tax=Allorhizocola rhizosphaerae TaxID=1872709 RepID=UPI000E3C8BB5|nr:hypothetical protein [Allorhizocola rhizosphaerae]
MTVEPGQVIIGELPPPAEGPLGSVPYQTIELNEFHELGPDGRPARHRTVQTIRALVDGVSTHRYVFDLGEARVEQIHGGTPGDPYRIKGNLWAVELTLPRTLNTSDEHSLEYVTTFRDSENPVAPRFRRAAHRRIENAAFHVTFHPDRLPTHVWWARWADYRPPNDHIIERTPVDLDDQNAVARHVSVLEQAVAGFLWQFDQPLSG